VRYVHGSAGASSIPTLLSMMLPQKNGCCRQRV
jgi:hypothetical protein